jgi:hypothetical protein
VYRSNTAGNCTLRTEEDRAWPCLCGGLILDPASNDMDVLEAALAALDRAMERLRHQRADLRQRRNALMPISTLPSEIAAKVFHIACSANPAAFMYLSRLGGDWIPQTSKSSAAMTLSHVSRGFRGVALATSTLWTAIDVAQSEEMVHLLLERSRPMPLTIFTSDTESGDAPRLLHTLQHKKVPIRHLWLPYRYGVVSVRQALAQMQDTDVLESLQLKLPNNSAGPHIVASALQNLSVLSLEGPGRLIPSVSDTLSRLTRLALELDDMEPDEMLRAVRLIYNAPLLAELKIDFPTRGNLWDRFENTAPETVPLNPPTQPSSSCLKRMTLTGDHMCTLSLLHLVRPAPTCYTRLSEGFTWQTSGSLDSNILEKFLARHSSGQDVTGMTISPSHRESEYLRWRLRSGIVESSEHAALLDFEVNKNATPALALAIGWSHLVNLELMLKDYNLVDIIFDAIHGSRALVSVTIHGGQTAMRFLRRLHGSTEGEVQEFPFPTLTRMVLQGTRMRRFETGQGPLEEMHMLVCTALRRAALGVPWKIVVLRRCIFDGAVTLSTLCRELAQSVESVQVE